MLICLFLFIFFSFRSHFLFIFIFVVCLYITHNIWFALTFLLGCIDYVVYPYAVKNDLHVAKRRLSMKGKSTFTLDLVRFRWLVGWLVDWLEQHTYFAQWALWPRNPLCFVCDESTRRPWDALLTLLVGLELTGWFRVSVSRRFAVQPVELTCSIQYWILLFFFSKWCIS